ncbi:MAG: SDR family NAD(P)-dependent oxidoreductase [Blastopirellula sp.]|nr:SDR family NAD(P)-dependent oxidoreductase [Blastopirellula sp.]
MQRLAEKVIIVTGSCTGIGKAIARRAVAEGARVVIHGLHPELGAALCAELGPDRTLLRIEDLTLDGSPERLVALTIDRFGRVDGLVNNAALIAPGNIHTTDANRFLEFLAINTLAPYLLIRAALPWLQKTGGSVLNIGSVNAHCGEPDLLPYSVSKGALQTMTRNLGDTLFRENGVRVNQINPGWVLTEVQRKSPRRRSTGWPTSADRSAAKLSISSSTPSSAATRPKIRPRCRPAEFASLSANSLPFSTESHACPSLRLFPRPSCSSSAKRERCSWRSGSSWPRRWSWTDWNGTPVFSK